MVELVETQFLSSVHGGAPSMRRSPIFNHKDRSAERIRHLVNRSLQRPFEDLVGVDFGIDAMLGDWFLSQEPRQTDKREFVVPGNGPPHHKALSA